MPGQPRRKTGRPAVPGTRHTTRLTAERLGYVNAAMVESGLTNMSEALGYLAWRGAMEVLAEMEAEAARSRRKESAERNDNYDETGPG